MRAARRKRLALLFVILCAAFALVAFGIGLRDGLANGLIAGGLFAAMTGVGLFAMLGHR